MVQFQDYQDLLFFQNANKWQWPLLVTEAGFTGWVAYKLYKQYKEKTATEYMNVMVACILVSSFFQTLTIAFFIAA